MKIDRYIYPAVFDYVDDGISVVFPGLPGCLTCGNTDEEAVSMAKEAMALHLYSMEKDDDPTMNSHSYIDQDRLFKELIQTFFEEFMILFFPEAYEEIDFQHTFF